MISWCINGKKAKGVTHEFQPLMTVQQVVSLSEDAAVTVQYNRGSAQGTAEDMNIFPLHPPERRLCAHILLIFMP